MLLQDEIDRRASQGLTHRIEAAGFDEVVTYEQFVWDTPVSYDRARVRDLFGLHWLAAHDNVIFCGPVGVGKSWFAEALGHSACRIGHHVRYVKVAKLLLAPAPTTPSSGSCTAGSPPTGGSGRPALCDPYQADYHNR